MGSDVKVRRTFEKQEPLPESLREADPVLERWLVCPSLCLTPWPFPALPTVSCSSPRHLERPPPGLLGEIRQPPFMYVRVCWQPLWKAAGTHLEGKGAVSHHFSTHCCEPPPSDSLLSPVQTSCTRWGTLKRKGEERNVAEHSATEALWRRRAGLSRQTWVVLRLCGNGKWSEKDRGMRPTCKLLLLQNFPRVSWTYNLKFPS